MLDNNPEAFRNAVYKLITEIVMFLLNCCNPRNYDPINWQFERAWRSLRAYSWNKAEILVTTIFATILLSLILLLCYPNYRSYVFLHICTESFKLKLGKHKVLVFDEVCSDTDDYLGVLELSCWFVSIFAALRGHTTTSAQVDFLSQKKPEVKELMELSKKAHVLF